MSTSAKSFVTLEAVACAVVWVSVAKLATFASVASAASSRVVAPSTLASLCSRLCRFCSLNSEPHCVKRLSIAAVRSSVAAGWEVAVIDALHSLEQFHVGRFDVQVAHSGAVGNEWTTVSTATGFGIDLSHYADYIRAPFDVFPQLVSFEEAEHECVEYGGHLASVHTDAELEALQAEMELTA